MDQWGLDEAPDAGPPADRSGDAAAPAVEPRPIRRIALLGGLGVLGGLLLAAFGALPASAAQQPAPDVPPGVEIVGPIAQLVDNVRTIAEDATTAPPIGDALERSGVLHTVAVTHATADTLTDSVQNLLTALVPDRFGDLVPTPGWELADVGATEQPDAVADTTAAATQRNEVPASSEAAETQAAGTPSSPPSQGPLHAAPGFAVTPTVQEGSGGNAPPATVSGSEPEFTGETNRILTSTNPDWSAPTLGTDPTPD